MKVDKQQHDREDGGERLKVSVHVFFPIPRFFLVSQAIYQSVVLLFFQETSNIFHLISHGPVFQKMRLVREVPGKEKTRLGFKQKPHLGGLRRCDAKYRVDDDEVLSAPLFLAPRNKLYSPD